MSDLLLPLLVAVPILAATLPPALGLRFDRTGWRVAAATTVALLGLALSVAADVFRGGEPIYHALGGYPRQYGIELVADELSALVVLLVAVVAVATLVYTRTLGPHGDAFYSGYLLLTGGLMGVGLTGDLFNLFVFLEIVGLATYALVASDRSGRSAYAALKYLFLGTVGASLYLIGVGYAFLATGTLNMLELQVALAEAGYTSTLVRAAFGFVVVGFGLKIALFPLHAWQPDAYTHAPDAVTAYIAALVSTLGAYALIRVTYTVFTVEFLRANGLIVAGLLALACTSIVAGSLLAAMQTEVKRMFAYSSVAQFGIVVAALGIANETALRGAVIHLVGHGLMKGALFFAAAALAAGYGARTVRDYADLAEEAPFTAGAMSVLGLALVGIPPSIGFLGKWYVALGAVEAGMWPVAAVIFVSTLLTLTYVARIVEALYFSGTTVGREHAPATDGGGRDGPAPATDGGGSATTARGVTLGMLLVVVLFALATVALGFAGGAFESLLEPFIGRVL